MQCLKSRAVLDPTNSRLQSLNSKVGKNISACFLILQKLRLRGMWFHRSQNATVLRYPVELPNSIEGGVSLPDHEIVPNKGFVVTFLLNIKPSSGHINVIGYVIENMTPNVLFLTSVSGSKNGERLVLTRKNCTVLKEYFPIPGFWIC